MCLCLSRLSFVGTAAYRKSSVALRILCSSLCVDSDFNGFGSSLYYRAKADGKLYCSEWYQDENKNWYYYKEDASMARGTTKIGETTYYFDVDGVL